MLRRSSLMRLFSTLSSIQKSSTTTSSISKEEISRAIKLLSDNNHFSLNSNVITEKERNSLINQFTNALNTDIKQESTSVKSHFNQSILGLNELLSSNVKTASLSKDVENLDFISIKELISKCQNEYELLQTFDHFVHNNLMNITNFRLFLLNKNLINLDHIIKKFEFMDPSNKEYLKHKLLLTTKALMIKNQSIASQLYEENVMLWLDLLKRGEMSKLLEKSFYQVHYKIKKDLKLLLSLKYTTSSYITLVETLPRQLLLLRELEHVNSLHLTKNQDYLLQFITAINKLTVDTESNALLRSLLKLSIDNKVHRESGEELTVSKCRFANGLMEINEKLPVELTVLSKDDFGDVYSETVLRFV